MRLALRDVVRHEESQCERVVVAHASRPLARQANVLLLQLEVLLVKHLGVIVHNDPKRLTLPVPTVVPIELGRDRHLNFQNSPCDGLDSDLSLKVGYVADEFVKLVRVGTCDVPASFIEFALIQIVHTHAELLQAVHDVVLKVAEAGHLRICVRQFPHRAVKTELAHDVSAWQNSLIQNLAPVQCAFHHVRVISLQCDLEQCSQKPSTVLDNVGHVRDQTESLQWPVFQVGFKQKEHLRRSLIRVLLGNLDDLALSHELIQLSDLFFASIELLELIRVSQVVEDHLWLSRWPDFIHEVRHSLRIDIVVACDATHIR
mmetsp:Transcript_37238/g.45466  ORF Transcript_37238/g.45466 Transcript_37238/m.45466 type:complete len:316 (+) Transcript_37238:3191-4138(+)